MYYECRGENDDQEQQRRQGDFERQRSCRTVDRVGDFAEDQLDEDGGQRDVGGEGGAGKGARRHAQLLEDGGSLVPGEAGQLRFVVAFVVAVSRKQRV